MSFYYNVLGQEQQLTNISLAMPGAHQAANAAVALATIEELRHQGWCVSVDAIRSGLSRAILPGALKYLPAIRRSLSMPPTTRLQRGALVAALAELPTHSRRTLVLSVSHDKDVRAILAELAPCFDQFIVTQYQDNPRAVSAETLAAMMNDVLRSRGMETLVCRTPVQAWHHVIQNATRRTDLHHRLFLPRSRNVPAGAAAKRGSDFIPAASSPRLGYFPRH